MRDETICVNFRLLLMGIGAAPTTRELQYRGYKITIARVDHGWRISAQPISPFNPILRRQSFFVSSSSQEDALAFAKGLVDAVLQDMEWRDS